jgi:N-acetyl-gamma-glutamyl-phosphate reductase
MYIYAREIAMPIRLLIVGASGYSGAECLRLCAARDDVRIVGVTANASAGQRVSDLYPDLAGRCDLAYVPFEPDRLPEADVAFVALPSGQGMGVVPELLTRVGRVIDLGGDFRLESTETYRRYYGHEHTAPHLLGEAVYGLPELYREQIAVARLVANPGCYPTSAILGLLPALASGVVSPSGIVINSLSGVSGAGRSASVEMSFAEVNESVRAYKIGTHQHIPEIEQSLRTRTGVPVSLSFVPHLLPVTRGIYTTIHATLARPVSAAEVLDLYRTHYRHEPFVRVTERIPQMSAVTRTNYCDIGLTVEGRTNQLIIISTIDNLVKGAAGQALQNMNIMFGVREDLGLR